MAGGKHGDGRNYYVGGERCPSHDLEDEVNGVKVTRRRTSYREGYKYCSRCQVFYLTDSNRCPLGHLLRSKPKRLRGNRGYIDPEKVLGKTTLVEAAAPL